MDSVAAEHGGYEHVTFSQKDANNFIDLERKLRLGEGDASALQKHFFNMQKRNSDFFYVIDYDEDNRIRNVFWADARSRVAYESFGDVVSFDTTYLTNRYDMPFALFVGVNHHGQSILLGCALLCKEDELNFCWLFETWKQCMGGVGPPCIITDQCGAMRLAIARVFPNAKHRWCLWHIMKKIPKKIGKFGNYKLIKKRLQHIVYDSIREDEFDSKWELMLKEYFPNGHEWLAYLFTNRARWVPAYLKGFFWAGMSTTQRSESMNAFFDGYVNSKTSLRSFIEQYDVAMLAKVEKENVADHASSQTVIQTFSGYQIEKQFQLVYTRAKFKQFQDELRGTIYCTAKPLGTIGSVLTFEVCEDVFYKDHFICKRKPEVRIDRQTNDVSCDCRLFEFKGIMCCHSLMVYRHCSVLEAPLKYVLPRWFKDVKRKYNFIRCCYQEPRGRSKEYHLLCDDFFELAALIENDEAKVSMVRKAIRTAKMQIDAYVDVNVVPKTHLTPGMEHVSKPNNVSEDVVVPESDSVPLNPVVVKRKGRPRSKRLVGADEAALKRKSRNGARKDVTPVYYATGMVPMQPYANGPSATTTNQFLNSNLLYVVGAPNHGSTMRTMGPQFVGDPNHGSVPQYYLTNFEGQHPLVHPGYSPRFSSLLPMVYDASSSKGRGSMSYPSESFQQNVFPTQGTQDNVNNQVHNPFYYSDIERTPTSHSGASMSSQMSSSGSVDGE